MSELSAKELGYCQKVSAIAKELKTLFEMQAAGINVRWLIELKRKEIRELGESDGR